MMAGNEGKIACSVRWLNTRKKIHGNDSTGRQLQVRKIFKMILKVKIYTFSHNNFLSFIERRKSYILKIMFRSNLTV